MRLTIRESSVDGGEAVFDSVCCPSRDIRGSAGIILRVAQFANASSPLVARRGSAEFWNFGVPRLLSAPNRTLETGSLKVCC